MTTNDLSDITSYMIERFRSGLGLRLRRRELVIDFIPTGLLEPSGTGLLVVLEGKGSYVWDGKSPMNAFRLAGTGFPLVLAEEVAEIMNRTLEAARVNPVQPKQLENK